MEMAAIDQILTRVDTFIFVLIRVSSILMMIPFFGSRNFPMRLRMGLALMLGLVITPVIGVPVTLPETFVALYLGVAREILIGASIGFLARLVFASVELAGQVTGVQMGFAVANVIDPQTSSQLSVVAQFYNILAILLFFALNMHLVFIGVIRESFELVPPYGFTTNATMIQGLMGAVSGMFKVALKLAAPIMVAILLANIAMGVLARTVPQLNVFIVGFPITITLGLTILALSMPYIIANLSNSYTGLSNDMQGLMRAAQAG